MANYQDPNELAEELVRSQRSGQPTARVCEIFLNMAERFLRGPKYNKLDQVVKEDLISACLIKCIKSIKNFKPEGKDGKKSNPFSYYTRAIETTIWTQLGKEKRHQDLINSLTEAYKSTFEEQHGVQLKVWKDED